MVELVTLKGLLAHLASDKSSLLLQPSDIGSLVDLCRDGDKTLLVVKQRENIPNIYESIERGLIIQCGKNLGVVQYSKGYLEYIQVEPNPYFPAEPLDGFFQLH